MRKKRRESHVSLTFTLNELDFQTLQLMADKTEQEIENVIQAIVEFYLHENENDYLAVG